MTSVQTMFVSAGARRCAVLALALAGCLAGCENLGKRDELTPPPVIASPYAGADVLWAVVPLANESGTELVDPLAISDKLIAAAERVEGVRTVPLNRTLQAMHASGMDRVRTPSEIGQLASLLGVDGVLVGSITAYDPYDPPTLGLTLALHAHTAAMGGAAVAGDAIDPRALSASAGGAEATPGRRPGGPASVVSAVLDAKDHRVLAALREYATGRHDPVSAMGWRRYTASMDLYTQFAAGHMVSALLAEERRRVVEPGASDRNPSGP